MKKFTLALAASSLLLLGACGDNTAGKKMADDGAAAIDSAMPANDDAGQNVDEMVVAPSDDAAVKVDVDAEAKAMQ